MKNDLIYSFMSFIEFFVAIAGGIFVSITPIIYFCRSGTNLESRINRTIKEKSEIISNSYLEILEEIFERFKKTRTLTYELEEKLEQISDTRIQLNDLPYRLSSIVDKLTHSVYWGILSALLLIIFAYIPQMGFDPENFSTVTVIVGILSGLTIIYFFKDGVLKIDSLRNFQKLVNKLELCRTFDQLYETILIS